MIKVVVTEDIWRRVRSDKLLRRKVYVGDALYLSTTEGSWEDEDGQYIFEIYGDEKFTLWLKEFYPEVFL